MTQSLPQEPRKEWAFCKVRSSSRLGCSKKRRKAHRPLQLLCDLVACCSVCGLTVRPRGFNGESLLNQRGLRRSTGSKRFEVYTKGQLRLSHSRIGRPSFNSKEWYPKILSQRLCHNLPEGTTQQTLWKHSEGLFVVEHPGPSKATTTVSGTRHQLQPQIHSIVSFVGGFTRKLSFPSGNGVRSL